MKRFLRRLSTPKSEALTSAERIGTDLVTQSKLITPEEPAAGEKCVDLTNYKLSDLVNFEGAVFPNSISKYDDLFITNSGHFIVRTAFTDSSGKRLGWDKVQVYVISPSGRVVLAEKNGILIHPKVRMADLLCEGKEHDESMVNQVEVTSKALDMAFRKDRRSDARWQHQAHVLETLESELVQTMKNILRTKKHTAVLQESVVKTGVQLGAIRDHEVSKLEGVACSADPDNYKRYTDISTPQDSRALIKDLTKTIVGLELIRDLTQRKYATQRRQEKPQEKGKGRGKGKIHVERPVKVRSAAAASKSGSGVARRGGLVQTLLLISDERRRGEHSPPSPPPPPPPMSLIETDL